MTADSRQGSDVIVIGAGISGLCAAGLLARSGLSVHVIEAQPRPGGYLQGFSRKGFQFDSAILWLNGMGPDGFVSRIFKHIGKHQPVCKPLKNIWRFKGDSYEYLLTNNPDELRDSLIHDFPAEEASLRLMFKHAKDLGRRMRILKTRMRAPDTMSIPEKSIFGLKMLAWYLPIRSILRKSMESGLGRYIKDPGLFKIFSSEEKLSSLMVPLAWAYEGDFFAAPPGGSQAFISWLMDTLGRLGVRIDLGKPARRVMVGSKGRVHGVELDDGTVSKAPWVIAACDVESLYERMLPEFAVPQKLISKLHAAELYYSSFTLFCGLNRPAQELGFGEEIIRLTRDGISCDDQNSQDVTTAAVSIFAPSVRDASLVPESKGSLTIQCPARISDHDHWHTGPGLERGKEYNDHKQALAQLLLQRIERQMGMDLRNSIEELSIATPVTFWRYTWNRDGSIMGAKPTDKNIKAHLAHYRTPVKGLLLAGTWAEYGGGLPMAVKSAANVSALILKRQKPEAFKGLKRVMDVLP